MRAKHEMLQEEDRPSLRVSSVEYMDPDLVGS